MNLDAATKRAIQTKWTRSITSFGIVAAIAVVVTGAYRKTGPGYSGNMGEKSAKKGASHDDEEDDGIMDDAAE